MQEKITNNWVQRDITFFGRKMLTKMKTVSRLIYPVYSLALLTKTIKEITKF